MRRVLGDTITSVGGVLLVLLALVVFDDRVRSQAATIVGSDASADLTSVGGRLRDFALVVIDVARDQSLDHAPLMIFALVATVLVLFMLRT